MSDVSRLIAAADTFEPTAFDGAEEDFILPDDFVKNFPSFVNTAWIQSHYTYIYM